MTIISQRHPQVTRTAAEIREAMRTARTESELAALVEESLRASRTAPAPSATPPASRTLPPAAPPPSAPVNWRQMSPKQIAEAERAAYAKLTGRGHGSSAMMPWGNPYGGTARRASSSANTLPSAGRADISAGRGDGAVSVSGGLRAL